MAQILFDLTRTFSRLDRSAPTGIDRVERALFDALSETGPIQAMIRSGGQCWMGAGTAMSTAINHIGPMDLTGRLQPWRNARRRKAESGLRATLGRATTFGTAQSNAGRWLLCVGHSLPDPRALALWRAQGGRLAVLVHDLIPLNHPEWCRTAPAQRFATAMQATAKHADLVLHLTTVGQRRWLARYAHRPGQHHAILPMGATQLPLNPRQPRTRPNFLMIGTIEPRKGHATVLDIWDNFASTADLTIIGQRGWNNEAVFGRLDARPASVYELNAPSDAALSTQIATAHTLLFPSLAEGYGLPVMEARAHGLPVLASDLPELRELHENAITYVTPRDADAWRVAICKSLQQNEATNTHKTVFWTSWIQSARFLRNTISGI